MTFNEKTNIDEGRFLKPKSETPPKSTLTMSLKQLLQNKKDNPGQSPFKTQDDKIKKHLEVSEDLTNEAKDTQKISTAQMGHAGKTTIKHIKEPGVQLRMAAHDVKPGISGYRDRIALLKAAQAQGKLRESLSKDATSAEWIDDFVNSNDPKFEGKSKEERKQMALAAYYAKQRNEGVEPKGFHGLPPEGPVMTDMEKEQQAIYDAQTIQFKKDAKANSDLKAKPMKESEFKGTPKVTTNKYSWGTMKTVHHGSDFSIPLHPEHHQAISKLKDAETHSFQDETKAKWTATRKGDTVHFKGNQGQQTTVPHSSLKESMKASFKEYLEEISTKAKQDYVAAASKSVTKLGSEAKEAEEKGEHEAKEKKVAKMNKRNDTAIKTAGKADIETRKKWNSDFGKNESTAYEEVAESVKAKYVEAGMEEAYDWSGSSRVIHRGTYGSETHVAPNERKPAGTPAEKKSVGRPKGEYSGAYNIDYEKRDTPEAKKALSDKVRAAKAEGNKDRAEFKRAMHAEIMKKQLKSAGLNPADHKDAIEKELAKVSKVK